MGSGGVFSPPYFRLKLLLSLINIESPGSDGARYVLVAREHPYVPGDVGDGDHSLSVSALLQDGWFLGQPHPSHFSEGDWVAPSVRRSCHAPQTPDSLRLGSRNTMLFRRHWYIAHISWWRIRVESDSIKSINQSIK